VTGSPTGPPEATGTFGTINRRDGSVQGTYNGRPLYRFVDDEAPGDASGDGVGGLWRAVEP
jgi:predicted lipoprotein with Yx(FWY)xxD motif